jgi:sortase (surface protein transpeptidase)
MLPTPDETPTLITCGGTFDPVKRQFSERLIVTAKPLD